VLTRIKLADLHDADAITGLLEDGTASRRDVAALLIYIREDITGDLIEDIAHCVAHTKRDRGYAYRHISRVVNQMLAAFEKGGSFGVELVFPIEKVIEQLADVLIALGIGVDRRKVIARQDALEHVLGSVLTETVIELPNPKVARCELALGLRHGKEVLTMNIHLSEELVGAVSVPTNVGLSIPVFGHIE
jgi:hypothetical protein